ncbi:hypothetical protein OTSTA763_2367 [Orientia tsutsugamushi str. TA763]|nr:hypothetical protein OTSTA763_2367 [Orientia tsutsugamushi str. TA763]
MVIRVMMLMVLLFVNNANANAFFLGSKKLLFLSHFQ